MAQLPSQSQFGDYGEWPGRDVLDSGGERLGGVREIYLDRETGRPEWVLVDVDGDEARFVPLADAAVGSSAIRVAHSASTIRKAPGIGTEPRIDQSEERRLYDHYGIAYSTEESASGLPAEEPTREHEHPPTGPTQTAWGAPDAAGTSAPDATSSWSAAAEEEPSELAPLPADPPTPAELEPEPEAVPGPDVFTPPAAAEPVSPPPWTPPPAPEPAPSGALAVVKSRKAGIAAGISIAAVLLFIIRRLR